MPESNFERVQRMNKRLSLKLYYNISLCVLEKHCGLEGMSLTKQSNILGSNLGSAVVSKFDDSNFFPPSS